ncbi:MAG: D-inositol-3-phosphate glycosyltransferase [Microgenomates bacterium OLB22]|nr:MAG: D-inositol-3-phosphate glycosyltransferase [Microgenomates bacterium OLB22]
MFTSLDEPDLELLIAGPSGWGDPVIVDNKRIRQLGYVEEHDLASLYQLSLGCVFPSLYEGFGYPVAEAITLGIPVACSNNSSLGEIAGDAAITFDPHSPEDMKRGLKSLVHDTALRNTIVKNCTARSNLFTPEHFRMQLLSLIKAL